MHKIKAISLRCQNNPWMLGGADPQLEKEGIPPAWGVGIQPFLTITIGAKPMAEWHLQETEKEI